MLTLLLHGYDLLGTVPADGTWSHHYRDGDCLPGLFKTAATSRPASAYGKGGWIFEPFWICSSRPAAPRWIPMRALPDALAGGRGKCQGNTGRGAWPVRCDAKSSRSYSILPEILVCSQRRGEEGSSVPTRAWIPGAVLRANQLRRLSHHSSFGRR